MGLRGRFVLLVFAHRSGRENIISGYYGNYGMGGGAGAGGSWYRGAGQTGTAGAGWVGGAWGDSGGAGPGLSAGGEETFIFLRYGDIIKKKSTRRDN